MPLNLDLDLAFKRVERDLEYKRTFFLHPYELLLVRLRRAEWLAELTAELEDGTWSPSTPSQADIPKAGGAVRPGALLCLQDQVVYTALVGSALGAMRHVLDWSVPPKDYAHQVWHPETADWVSLPLWCWPRFRERSLALLGEAALVVSTDITGFYEHIDHHTLLSDLKQCKVNNDVLALLTKCLSRWAVLNGQGLPQNVTASHLLAKLYLTLVDQGLAQRQHVHIRYVDDMRIFCQSKAEGKRALLALSVLLRSRGLNLQSAKTDFLLPGQALAQFQGAQTVLVPLAKHYVEAIAKQLGLDPAYLSIAEAEKLVAAGQAVIPTEMLRALYDTHFIKAVGKFDKTLFHFLILRLGRAKDSFALDHALSLLEPHPEETSYVLSYLASIGAMPSASDRLLKHFESNDAVYPYQVYQFIDWLRELQAPQPAGILTYARSMAAGPNVPPYLRSAIRALLGRFGTPADLDDLMRSYGDASSDLERAEILCGLVRAEEMKRNAFFGKLKGDGFLVDTAIAAIKQGERFGAA